MSVCISGHVLLPFLAILQLLRNISLLAVPSQAGLPLSEPGYGIVPSPRGGLNSGSEESWSEKWEVKWVCILLRTEYT